MFSPRDLRFVPSTNYVRKGSQPFYLNYPKIKEIGKPDHMDSETEVGKLLPNASGFQSESLSAFPFKPENETKYMKIL